LLIGLAVRWADAEARGWVPGILAALIAVPSLLGGKYLAVQFMMAREFANITTPNDVDPEFAKVELANEVVAEYEGQKKTLYWPPKNRLLTSDTKGPQSGEEFPADVWKEMSRRWDKLTPPEKEQRLSVAKKNLGEKISRLRARAVEQAFERSFSPFDLLWLLLAIATAFRVGSRLVTADD
jgi:hypothetical protein